MTYRVQIDLSFMDIKDANDFIKHVKSLQDKLYTPKLSEIENRPDLWTNNRISLIRDFDDEGKNRGGESVSETLFPIEDDTITDINPDEKII